MTAKKQPPRLRLWRCFSNWKGILNSCVFIFCSNHTQTKKVASHGVLWVVRGFRLVVDTLLILCELAKQINEIAVVADTRQDKPFLVTVTMMLRSAAVENKSIHDAESVKITLT